MQNPESCLLRGGGEKLAGGCSPEHRYDITLRKATVELFYRQMCGTVTMSIIN